MIIGPAPLLVPNPEHQRITFEEIPSDVLLALAAHKEIGKVFVAYHNGMYYARDDNDVCWKWPAAKLVSIA